jgi:hypothetical protein
MIGRGWSSILKPWPSLNNVNLKLAKDGSGFSLFFQAVLGLFEVAQPWSGLIKFGHAWSSLI